MSAEAGFPIDVSLEGDIAPRDVDRAQEHLSRAADLVPDRVLHGQLRLSMAPSLPPAPDRLNPAKVEGALDVGGQPVRAQVTAPTMREAVDRFADRLRTRVTRFVGRRRARRDEVPEPEPPEPPRTEVPTDRPPDVVDLPPEEREIVRRKSFAAPFSTPDEAVFDMEALDHDFFLFRNAESGEENLVFRTPDGGYELIQRTPGSTGDDVGAAPIRPSSQVPPRIPVQDAVTALNVGDQPFIFFVDAEDDEAAVLYRRYDGHYGLITLEGEG